MAEKTVPAPGAQPGRNGSTNREVTRAPQRHIRPPVLRGETKKVSIGPES